jgi:hypothetical protein
MRSAGIVKAEVTADRGAGLGDRVVGFQINLLVFGRSPQALDEHIVSPGSFAIHADGNAGFEKNISEAGAGELAALIRIEDVRPSVTGQSFIQRLDAELRFHGDRQPPGENPAAEPVDDGCQIDEAARHRDVRDVHGPDLVGSDDRQVEQEIGVNLVPRRWLRGVGLTIDRLDPHALHQRGDMSTADDNCFRVQEIT